MRRENGAWGRKVRWNRARPALLHVDSEGDYFSWFYFPFLFSGGIFLVKRVIGNLDKTPKI